MSSTSVCVCVCVCVCVGLSCPSLYSVSRRLLGPLLRQSRLPPSSSSSWRLWCCAPARCLRCPAARLEQEPSAAGSVDLILIFTNWYKIQTEQNTLQLKNQLVIALNVIRGRTKYRYNNILFCFSLAIRLLIHYRYFYQDISFITTVSTSWLLVVWNSAQIEQKLVRNSCILPLNLNLKWRERFPPTFRGGWMLNHKYILRL